MNKTRRKAIQDVIASGYIDNAIEELGCAEE